MYSTGGGVANGGRIHNPRPDPAEVGPPRRVNREESHIGEMVAASKRRIAWTFTLGESDTIHEVVLVHSKLTYKKSVEFDGRQMHFSSSATPGGWSYTMFLDNTSYAIEVRINDLESEDVPKYDLVIDRIPFRRWDVYRRRKQPNRAAPGAAYGGSHQPYRQQYQPQGAAQSNAGGGVDSFGKHKWGPSGMTAPPPMEASPPAHAQRNSGSFFRGDVPNSNYQSPPPPAPAQYNGAAPQRQSFHGAPAQASSAAAPATQAKRPPQKEIDLLGDFGSSEASTVTAQQLIFDPLAGTKLGAAPQQPNRTASNPMMPTVVPPQANMRTASNPQMGFSQQTQPYVDPFANVAQPVPIKPSSSSFNLDPLASQNSMYMQPNRAPQVATPSYPVYQPPQGGMPRGMPMQQPQQQQPMQGGFPVPMGTMPTANAGYQPPKVGGGAGGANYNISHLMNPMEVNSVRNAQQTKTINIDPFAGMQHK